MSSVNKQSFTANGSTTSFTLTHAVSNANDLEVFVGNVRQEPTAYTASGTTLDFGSGNAPPNGVNLYIIYKNLAQNNNSCRWFCWKCKNYEWHQNLLVHCLL